MKKIREEKGADENYLYQWSRERKTRKFEENSKKSKQTEKYGREYRNCLFLRGHFTRSCYGHPARPVKSGNFHVNKMRFISKEDKRTIIFNENIRIENIPLATYDYIVNGKSAIEWVMERYAITTNPESKIVNDPNQWSENPRYILDLLLRLIQMSLDTMKIVTKLPSLNLPD